MVACIAFGESGALIAATARGIFRLILGDAAELRAERLAAPPELRAGIRCNDGRCNRQGRFWSGTMVMDVVRADGRLYRYTTADGILGPVVDGLATQNGLAWSPVGRTMCMSDSHPSRQLIWQFDYDIDAGMPHNQRLFVDMNSRRGRPDGAAIDSDGCYWICGNDGGVSLRFTSDGVLDSRMLHMQIACISLVATECEWYKSRHGVAAQETPGRVSPCSHAIANDAPLIVSDTRKDARFADSGQVTGESLPRFYAGVPLHGKGGQLIGTFCVADHVPRALTQEDVELLISLAKTAADLIAMRQVL